MITKVQKRIHDYLKAWNQNNQYNFKTAFEKVLLESLKYTDPSYGLQVWTHWYIWRLDLGRNFRDESLKDG
ncbi:hypothetical protein GA0116948_10156 [Chitinophaga costaii]|uniref:Uncharacterized protein n=1 Tax=Chitinophaga costaii TaxID=1335309 RepID=A0A1C3YR15_9BACT|nr:hypothetical protein DCM91_00870 [Chitinophaga costaii]SCB72521.1 hypothetical protein GA0116948_10156 [Chitinophaga costaii]